MHIADNKSIQAKQATDWFWVIGVSNRFPKYCSQQGDSSHYSCLSRVSPVLGRGSVQVSCPKTLPPKKLQWGSNPGPLDYESNVLPLSHDGPLTYRSYNKACLLENNMRKGKIACYQHFLFFPQCFQRPSFSGHYQYTTQSWLLWTLRKEAFENILGKGENAGNQHFLLFPKNVFFIFSETNLNF